MRCPRTRRRGCGNLLRRCLLKDPHKRMRDIGEVRIAIEDIIAGPELSGQTQEASVPPRTTGRLRGLAIVGVAGLLLGSAMVLWVWSPWHPAPASAPMRLSTELGADASLSIDIGSATLAISPDGQTLAFTGAKGGKTQLYVRRLGQLQATPLAGTEDAISPFFKPDGQWIGFFAGGKLKKISVTGGAAVTLCDAPLGRGGTWGEDGSIVFTPNGTGNATLLQVSSDGGKPETQTTLAQGETTHRWPELLPGGKALLYTANTSNASWEGANIVVRPFPKGTPKVLVRGGYYARYLRSGHLVYMHDGTLFAAPFDIDRLELTGPAVPSVEGVSSAPTGSASGRAQFALSATGNMVYLPSQNAGDLPSIQWLDRTGKLSPLRATGADWSNPHFSPDGNKIAVDMFAEKRTLDIFVYEWGRDTLTPLTFGLGGNRKPVWTPDGRRIAFASTRGSNDDTPNIYWQRSDGTGEVQRLTESKNPQLPASFHPSGKYLAYWEQTQNSWDLMILPFEGDEASGWKPGKATVFLSTPSAEQEPMFSPDGHWIAYHTNESGINEVFVRPYPGPGGKWKVSTAGGMWPVWSRTRHELFYRTQDNRIMVSSYTVEGDSFKAEKPKVWSEQIVIPTPRNRPFDLHPDGERFAVSAAAQSPTEAPRDKVVFIFNFFDELRRIAPVSKK
jgi:serine/threonine-protein kinase